MTERPFWRQVTRFEAGKLSPAIALRNTLGMVGILALALAMASPRAAVTASIGALLVSYSDRHDPYRQRARRLLGASVAIALAITLGGLAGSRPAVAIALAAAAAFAAGMAVAVGQTAADVGRACAVMLIAYAAQPLSPRRALAAGGLALAGGLVQTTLSLLPW